MPGDKAGYPVVTILIGFAALVVLFAVFLIVQANKKDQEWVDKTPIIVEDVIEESTETPEDPMRP